jgi:hypothetical protein
VPEEVTINSESYLRIENHTKNNMTYGTDFSMDYFFNNQWEPIDFDFYFTEIGLGIQAGETAEDLMNLYALVEEYNNACEGKYRIIKNICNYYLTAEFNLIRNEPLEVSLTNTKWKLVRFVDVVSGKEERADPIAPMYNFLLFNEDQTLSGYSCNELYGNYEFDTATCYINIDVHAITELNESGDGKRFIESLNMVDFYSLQAHELRLYYNNKQNYLLLKPRNL